MVEARVPDDMRDWNAMDIFIFSNGQQYSPPRKYHLCSDDLKYWESTISFLAHSQYGSLHSKIDLYTIEGRKVNGPLELSNEAAYVAVTPPDPFIQSGYDKYLLKASRSWEKRQEKKLNATKSTPQEKLLHVSCNFETTTTINNKSPRDNPILTTEKERVNSKPNSTIKNKTSSYLKPFTRSSGIKDPLEKRKLLSAKTILRKVNNSGKSLDTSSQRESTNIKRIVPVNKSTIKDLSIPPLIDTIFETESESPNKVVPEQNHSPNITEIKENVVTENERNSFALGVIMNTNIPTDNHNMIKQSESERTSVLLVVDADKDIKDDIKNKPVEHGEFNNNLLNVMINERCTNHDDDSTKDVYHNPIITKEIGIQYSHISLNENTEQIQTKECILNLNLNIDLKGYKPHPKYNNEPLSKYYSLKAEESFTSLKLDFDKERLQTQTMFNNSVNSTKCVNDNVTSQSCDSTKFVVVRCSCSSHNSNNNKTSKLQCKEIPQDYFILVPKQELIKSDSKFETNMTNTDVKTDSVQMCPSNMNKLSEIVDNPAKNTSSNNAYEENISSNSKTDIVKEHKVSISTGNPAVKEYLTSSNQEISTKSDLPTETKVNENKKVFHNEPQCAWTQTEWCDVLVEARYNKSGGYTFHLPSLGKLKRYNL